MCLLPTLDSATVHLCSLLSSLSFGLLFVALWVMRDGRAFYLLCGGAALTYAATLVGFNMPARGLAFSTLLCIGVGAYNGYLLAALRQFEGRRPVNWLVVALPVVSGLSYLAFAFWPDGMAAGRLANSVVLGISTAWVGLMFLRVKGSRAPRSRRIVGVIQLAYVPSYAVSVGLEMAGMMQRDWLSLVPLLSDQMLLGVLNIALLSMPGELAEQELRDRARRDPLTGAWNRAGLDHIGQRHRGPMDVILFDVDNFKQLNDRYGHAAGDEMLQSLAAKANIVLPGDAYLIRLGGDEFAALVPAGEDLLRAAGIAEKLRLLARSETRCTISIGMARTKPDASDLAETFARADQMLYRAKAEGRDRIAA